MRGGARRWTVVAVVFIAFAASVLGTAQAQALPFHSQDQANAWREVGSLLRERSQPKPSGFDFKPSFEIQRDDGYKVVVRAVGSSVAVMVGKGNGAVTTYLARGTATSRRLKTSLGRFGRVDMRFHPAADQGCRRHSRFERQGIWTGSFRFTGEGGYLSIDAHRAAGQIRALRLSCSQHSGGASRRSRATVSGDPFSSFSLRQSFGAGWHRGLESAQVVGFVNQNRTLYFAAAQQAFSQVAILRLAVASDDAETFTVNGALTHAEASPPAPFHGTGIYTAAPDGTKSWLGDLTVNLPGAPAFPLTGEQFEVEVERPL